MGGFNCLPIPSPDGSTIGYASQLCKMLELSKQQFLVLLDTMPREDLAEQSGVAYNSTIEYHRNKEIVEHLEKLRQFGSADYERIDESGGVGGCLYGSHFH